MSVADDVISGVTSAPGKVLSMWQRPMFWVGAAVVVVILVALVLYVSNLRDYALAQLTARAITSGATAPAGTADAPQQAEPVKLAAA